MDKEQTMLSVLLAVVMGALVGRWLGSQAQPKLASQKVRVGDLRRTVRR
jgi:hypothetical protein